VYSIDTPPTISGFSISHSLRYIQVDAIARYHRMRGKAVFYPMGWDDKGCDERRYRITMGRCDPRCRMTHIVVTEVKTTATDIAPQLRELCHG